MAQHLKPDEQTRIMKKERFALKGAFVRCARAAESEEMPVGRLWLLFLARRMEELDCIQAEVTDWMDRAITAIEKEDAQK